MMKFVDLGAQFQVLEQEITAAMDKVIQHGQFIMGPEVGKLEQELSAYTGAAHTITCASGADALLLVLLAWDIQPGDAVFTTPFTFVATAEMIQLLGATPIFVDINEKTYNIDPTQLEQAINRIKARGDLKPRAIIPVDLYGLPANYSAINEVAEQHHLKVLADGCQSFGGQYKEDLVGTLAEATATSFFPAKPLGGYGDGGAVFTDNDDLADLVRSIRIHGMDDGHPFIHTRTGITGRLDTLQAAILRCKLKIFEQELKARQKNADSYNKALSGHMQTPVIEVDYHSTWAQYTLQSDKRALLCQYLHDNDIPTAIYYPMPLHRQKAFEHTRRLNQSMPISDALAERVFSIPIHPYLTQSDQARIIEVLLAFVHQP